MGKKKNDMAVDLYDSQFVYISNLRLAAQTNIVIPTRC